MYHPLSIYIGLRYVRAKRRNHFISFISLTSMIGITVGVVALITVLSVMNGFHKEVRERILGMASHAEIRSAEGGLQDWASVVAKAKRHPEVVGAAPFVEFQAMLTHRGAVSGAVVRGVDPALEPEVVDVGEHMREGSLDDLANTKYGVILGRELAYVLGAQVGDKVTLLVPEIKVTPAGSVPRLKRFTVTGIFEVGMGEYDSGVAIIHLPDAAKLLRLGDDVTGVRLKLADLFQARKVSYELANQLAGLYRVRNWTDFHRNFFAALETEKLMIGLILTLIVVVAAFNIVSTMVMVVVEKQADIAILRTFGATPGTILRAFMVHGMTIGVLGTLMGVAGGIALALNVEDVVSWIERLFEIRFIDPDIYYISKLPSHLEWRDVFVIGGGSLVLSLLASIYPAWRAARTQPAEALRYE